jgi:small conductance mechanosensitive channel
MDNMPLDQESVNSTITYIQDNMPIYLNMGLNVVSAALILIAGWIIGNWASKKINNISSLDKTLSTFLGGFSKYAILAVAVVAVLGQFGVETASLLAVLGAAGLAIGLALQGTLSNVAAGTMLLILRPFKVGDYITFGSDGGTVKSLGLFGTEFSTGDNIYIFVPNSHLWNAKIYNYSKHKERRHDITIGISYNDDIDKAIKTLETILKKEKRIITSKGKEPMIMVDSLADFSINLKLRCWCKSDDFWSVKWDLNKSIKESLEKEGITIPFPTRTIEIIDNNKKGSKKAA